MRRLLAMLAILVSIGATPQVEARQEPDTVIITVQARWTNDLLGIMERGELGEPCDIAMLLPVYTSVKIPAQIVVRNDSGVIVDAGTPSGGKWSKIEKPVLCESSIAMSVGRDTTFVQVDFFGQATQVYRVSDVIEAGITIQYDGSA